MTKPKAKQPEAPPRPRLELEYITLEYLADLKKSIEILRADVAFYRGKSERLELSIMNSDTQKEARIEYVERTDPAAGPSIRTAAVERGVTGTRPSFFKVRENWNKMTPAEQAAAMGDKPNETESAEPKT
jgi:hypothetical protein